MAVVYLSSSPNFMFLSGYPKLPNVLENHSLFFRVFLLYSIPFKWLDMIPRGGTVVAFEMGPPFDMLEINKR